MRPFFFPNGLLALPLAVLASACVIHTGDSRSSASRGPDQARDYALSGFSKVDASAGVTVVLRQGPYAVHAQSTRGDLSELVLEVRGDTLYAGRESNWFDWGRRPNYLITVSAPDYQGIGASSGSEVDGQGLSLRNLKVDVSSGADVDLTGSCTDLRVDVSSGADFDGSRLQCETASVGASSGADADAFATRTAKGDASSGADITFHGRPAAISQDTSSGGSVHAL
jgi:hypothetical protein